MSFFVTLPSNTKHDNNTAARFRCTLAHPIELQGQWEVGVASIQFPSEFLNVTDLWLRVSFKDIVESRRIEIKDGQYSRLKDLVLTIQEHINYVINLEKSRVENPTASVQAERCDVRYIPRQHQVVLHTNGGFVTRIDFSPHLYQLLGFEEDHITVGKSTSMLYGVSTKMSTFTQANNALYVYSDIVERQHVGNVKAPLLRIVPVIINDSPSVVVDYTNIHYVPLLQKAMNSIDIAILTDQGSDFPFLSGKSLVKLHFRKTKPF